MKNKLFTIIKSRFIKPKKDNEIERKRAICSGCKYNSNNSSKKFSYKIFLTSLSDFYSFITGNRKVDNLGNCLACTGCSIFYKTLYSSELCKHPEGSQWEIKTKKEMTKTKILKFGLEHCAPCKVMTGLMKDLNLTSFNVQEIDLYKNEDLAKKYNIKNVPTLIVLDEKEQEERRFRNFAEFKNYIEKP